MHKSVTIDSEFHCKLEVQSGSHLRDYLLMPCSRYVSTFTSIFWLILHTGNCISAGVAWNDAHLLCTWKYTIATCMHWSNDYATHLHQGLRPQSEPCTVSLLRGNPTGLPSKSGCLGQKSTHQIPSTYSFALRHLASFVDMCSKSLTFLQAIDTPRSKFWPCPESTQTRQPMRRPQLWFSNMRWDALSNWYGMGLSKKQRVHSYFFVTGSHGILLLFAFHFHTHWQSLPRIEINTNRDYCLSHKILVWFSVKSHHSVRKSDVSFTPLLTTTNSNILWCSGGLRAGNVWDI